jgi:hypothetical protein
MLGDAGLWERVLALGLALGLGLGVANACTAASV